MQRLHFRVRGTVTGKRLFEAPLQLGTADIAGLVEDGSERDAFGRNFDVGVDRPQRVDVRPLVYGERRPLCDPRPPVWHPTCRVGQLATEAEADDATQADKHDAQNEQLEGRMAVRRPTRHLPGGTAQPSRRHSRHGIPSRSVGPRPTPPTAGRERTTPSAALQLSWGRSPTGRADTRSP